MKKIIFLLTLHFCFHAGNAQFEIDSIAGGKCLRQAAAIKDRQTQRTAEYQADLEDYKKARFCYDCKRSATRIEREDHKPFLEHVEGTTNKRVERPTQADYDKLYNDYKRDYDNLEKQYWDKRKECNAAASNELNIEDNSFHLAYDAAAGNLSEIKKINPAGAANYENNYGARLNQLRQEFQTEMNKGKNASPSRVQNITARIKSVNDEIIDQKEKDSKNKAEVDKQAQARTQGQKSSASSNDNDKENSSLSRYEQELAAKRKEDSIKAVQRQNRVGEAKEKDRNEDLAFMSTAGTVAAAMMLVNDDYVDYKSNLKIHLGLGYESLPLIANDYNHSRTSVQTSDFPNIYLGFEARLNLTKKGGIGLDINPQLTYGWGAFVEGVSGTSMSYGGNATLFLSRRNYSKLHLFAEGGYIKRQGDLTNDLDAALGTASDIVYNASYDYSVLRYGGGIKLLFVKENGESRPTETYIKPGFFFERISFSKNSKPVMVGNIQLMFSSFLMIDFSYSKNYAVAGEATYRNNFEKENTDFYSVKLIRKGLIAPRK